MTLTFENENDVILYALENIIAFARRTQQIFVAQCIWWLSSVIGLELGLVTHIVNLHRRTFIDKNHLATDPVPKNPVQQQAVSPTPRDLAEDLGQCTVLKECDQYLQESQRLRDSAA
jgi:hypothetical protein